MTGHTACNGVNGEVDFAAVVFEHVAEFLNSMLSLGNSHTVTRNDNDALCSLEDKECILYGQCLGLLVLAGSGRCLLLDCLEEEGCKALVHCLAHDERKDDAGSTYETAGYDKYRVADREACESSSET